MKAAIGIGDAFRRVGPHPERAGFMMCRAEAVMRRNAAGTALNKLYGLTIGEDVRHLTHRGIHHSPKIVISLGRCKGHKSAPDAVFVRARVEIHTTRMRH